MNGASVLTAWTVSAVLLAGCAAGERAATGTSPAGGPGPVRFTAAVAEDPERLREVVVALIGEGPGHEAALEIVGRYEDDLRFVLDAGTAADNAPDSREDRLRRFASNSAAVAVIGLNECYGNFLRTGDDRYARKGLAHGYVALVSRPSPAQKHRVVELMTLLAEPFRKQ